MINKIAHAKEQLEGSEENTKNLYMGVGEKTSSPSGIGRGLGIESLLCKPSPFQFQWSTYPHWTTQYFENPRRPYWTNITA